MYRDNNKDLAHKEKEQTVKDKDNGKNWAHKDRKNDLKLVLKESRRTRTWINITAQCTQAVYCSTRSTRGCCTTTTSASLSASRRPWFWPAALSAAGRSSRQNTWRPLSWSTTTTTTTIGRWWKFSRRDDSVQSATSSDARRSRCGTPATVSATSASTCRSSIWYAHLHPRLGYAISRVANICNFARLRAGSGCGN